MLSLRGRKDNFRLLLPKEFLYRGIEEKYAEILQKKKGIFVNPIDYINETIQRVQVLGFQEAAFLQQQYKTGYPIVKDNRIRENEFPYPATEESYRAPQSALGLLDKTLNIEFRHTLGYLNYFMIFENFWYMYSRDLSYDEMMHDLYVDIFNEIGEIYCKIHIIDPIINGMDMLDFDYTQPIAASGSFKLEFKYSNLEFNFL